MRFLILGLLIRGPASLYDIQKRFTATISLFYSASFGSIQRAVSALVAAGQATVDDAPGDPRGKRLYAITPAGRAVWEQWMREEVAPGTEAERSILARVFFLGLLPRQDRPLVLRNLRETVDLSARGLAEVATGAEKARDDSEAEILEFQLATLAYGLQAHRVLGDWLDTLLRDANAVPDGD